jgi:hypothetical protein
MSNRERASSWITAWWPPLALAVLLFSHAGALAIGGRVRIAAWLHVLTDIPLAGAVFFVGAVVRMAWKRRVTKAIGATLVLSLIAIAPITWLLRLWPVAFPADIDSTVPTLEIRVPTDEPMRVAWGGNSAATNYHAMTPDQRWAYDLVVEPYFTGSAKLTDYGCFGVAVVAPTSGEVVQALDGEPDVEPGPPANPTAPYGNHVVIEPGAGGHLIIAHLKAGSVAVGSGDRVEEGQVIGACGNSGNTSEPHVHVHYQWEHPREVEMNFARGLPLYFRDHGGSPMPTGGFRREGDRLVALGEVIQHEGQ